MKRSVNKENHVDTFVFTGNEIINNKVTVLFLNQSAFVIIAYFFVSSAIRASFLMIVAASSIA